MQQIIDLNNKIILLESNIPNEIKSNKVLEGFKQSIVSIKNEQVELKNKISQIDVNNSHQYTSQNNRIIEVHSNINIWGFIFTFFGFVLVVGSIYLGLSAKATAIREARDTADEKITNWIKEEKVKIIASVENELKLIKDKATKELNEHVISAKAESLELSNLSEEYHKLIKKHDEEFNKKMTDFNNDENKEQKSIEKLNKNVKESLANKPEDDYTASDWLRKAVVAYYAGNYKGAIEIFDVVIGDVKASKNLIAEALYNKGIVLHKNLNQTQEALDVYKDLFERFEGSGDIIVKSIVAKSLSFKGDLILKLKGATEALLYLDTLIVRFSNSNELFEQVVLARSLMIKGHIFGSLGEFEYSIVSYDELIKIYSKSSEYELQKIVLETTTNVAEMSLLSKETDDKTLDRIKFSAERKFNTPENQVITSYLRFLLNDISSSEFLSVFDRVPKNTTFTWKFDEINEFINQLTGTKKLQALAIRDYIEKHYDIDVLKARLTEIDTKV